MWHYFSLILQWTISPCGVVLRSVLGQVKYVFQARDRSEKGSPWRFFSTRPPLVLNNLLSINELFFLAGLGKTDRTPEKIA